MSDEVENPARSVSDATQAIRTNPPLVMSLKEAAAFLGISYRKIREDIQARRIPHLRLGGKVLIRRDALLAALEKLEIRSV